MQRRFIEITSPDQALDEARDCIRRIESDDPAQEIPAAHDLALVLRGLDAHLLKGGVLPTDWRRIPSASSAVS